MEETKDLRMIDETPKKEIAALGEIVSCPQPGSSLNHVCSLCQREGNLAAVLRTNR